MSDSSQPWLGSDGDSAMPLSSLLHLGCAFAQFLTQEAAQKCLQAAQDETEVSWAGVVLEVEGGTE